jgi:hypothetical protein
VKLYVKPGVRKDNDVPLRDILEKGHDYQSEYPNPQTDLKTLMADLGKPQFFIFKLKGSSVELTLFLTHI